jgi:hypothetical protein
MSEMSEKLQVYNIAANALKGCSQEACASCICTENVLAILKKRLKKLKQDLNQTEIDKEEKAEFSAKATQILEIAEKLPVKADAQDCLMTKGICKLPKCIAHNISEMLNLVKP